MFWSGAELGGSYVSARYGGPNSAGYIGLSEARGLGSAARALRDLNLVVQL